MPQIHHTFDEPAGYRITFTEREYDTLAWLSVRYECAEVLYLGMISVNEDPIDLMFSVPEHVAWEYQDAVKAENGDDNAMLPPCAGGSLADKLISLWEAIV